MIRAALAVYALMSVATFAAFALDKRAARRGAWRISERTLHTLELLGGWPGALAARRLVRHKSAKRRYAVVLWLIVAAHVGAWCAWAALRAR